MNFSNSVKSFLKSLTGEEPQGDPSEKNKEKPDEGTKPDEGGNPGGGDGGNGGDGNGNGNGSDSVNKGLVDATDILNGLVSELGEISKSLKTLIDGQNDVGESIVGVAEMVKRVADTPLPGKSAIMAKGGAGNGAGAFPGSTQPDSVPTQDEFERAQAVLIKSYRDGEITLNKSEQISSDLQKSMRLPGFTMKPEDYNFLVNKMRNA
ncbi:MAG: hypothetical protein LBF78_06890 [Treponema sp.]|jgi:hypothetical protein|nr:hypothetical protein [Treponema sp.]